MPRPGVSTTSGIRPSSRRESPSDIFAAWNLFFFHARKFSLGFFFPSRENSRCYYQIFTSGFFLARVFSKKRKGRGGWPLHPCPHASKTPARIIRRVKKKSKTLARIFSRGLSNFYSLIFSREGLFLIYPSEKKSAAIINFLPADFFSLGFWVQKTPIALLGVCFEP